VSSDVIEAERVLDAQNGTGERPVWHELPQLLDGFITPNGMAFGPDGRTMYLSDSNASVQSVWAFDYHLETGTPSNRRLFIDMKPLPGRPDGAVFALHPGVCGLPEPVFSRFSMSL
jgi:sugar lactone lactonase YvrE